MQKYLRIGGSYFRGQYLPHLLLACLYCAISVCFISFRNLEAVQSAKVLEIYVSFAGILLMTPLLMPEQNREIWQLEKSKVTPMWQIYLVRLCIALCFVILLFTVFPIALEQNGSVFLWDRMWVNGISEMIFLGSIGFAVAAVTNQVVLGYMLAVIYYVANFGGREYFGKLALFQMMEGKYDFAGWMLGVSVLLVAGSIVIRERQR